MTLALKPYLEQTKWSKRPCKTRSNLNKHFPLFLCVYCSSVPTIPLLFSANETAISYPWTVQKNVENNKNNRGQKYPLQGVTGFNQVKLQLILDIAFCDYEEEKKE